MIWVAVTCATGFIIGWMASGYTQWQKWSTSRPELFPWNWRQLFDTGIYLDWLNRAERKKEEA